MRRYLLPILITLFALPMSAQRLNLDFPGLSESADEVIDVTLDASMLRMGAKFLSSNDRDQRDIRDVVSRLEGIYVRSYSFRKEGEYDRALVDRVRAQLGPSWKKIVNVRSKSRENVEVYTDTRGDAITGLCIISAEPKELTIVNIVGPIDLDKLSRLEGHMGIPRVSKSEEKHE